PLSSVNILTTLVNNNNGTYTYTNEAGVDTVINVNAGALPFSNTASGLAATTVQGAIDEIVAETTAQLGNFKLEENNDGSFSLIGADGTAVVSTINKGSVTDNANGTYTFNNGGTPVTIDASSLTITETTPGVYTFADAGGTVGILDLNASALNYNPATSGLTATTVQSAIDEIVANTNTQLGNFKLEENNDGSFSLIGADGTAVVSTIQKGSLADNG
ncbi:hypothetical protein ACX0HA_17600, partial [Flavobacterium hauense]